VHAPHDHGTGATCELEPAAGAEDELPAPDALSAVGSGSMPSDGRAVGQITAVAISGSARTSGQPNFSQHRMARCIRGAKPATFAGHVGQHHEEGTLIRVVLVNVRNGNRRVHDRSLDTLSVPAIFAFTKARTTPLTLLWR
jgi:hypothetical protein